MLTIHSHGVPKSKYEESAILCGLVFGAQGFSALGSQRHCKSCAF